MDREGCSKDDGGSGEMKAADIDAAAAEEALA